MTIPMIQMFLITFREGMEAFLIVAITSAYLKNTGRAFLVNAIFYGTIAAIISSIFLAVELAQYSSQPAVEAVMAMIATILVASMIIHMYMIDKTVASSLQAYIERSIQRNVGAWLGVFCFTWLMIVREGIEIVLLSIAVMAESAFNSMAIGAVLGSVAAFILGYLWIKYSYLVNMKLFFQVTSIFLSLFLIELVIYSFHEFCEAGLMPFLDNEYWHDLTEIYGPEGQYGALYSYTTAIIPLLWLIFSIAKNTFIPVKRLKV